MFPLERDGRTPTSPLQAARALALGKKEMVSRFQDRSPFSPALEGALAANSTQVTPAGRQEESAAPETKQEFHGGMSSPIAGEKRREGNGVTSDFLRNRAGG